mgnify:CR=1 FL=1
MDRMRNMEDTFKLIEIKCELKALILTEQSKANYHKNISKDVKSEYFYRGRVALMKHLLKTIEKDVK